MGPRSSRQVPNQIQNLSKNLLIQFAFPQVGQKFQKAEFFLKTQEMRIHIPIDNQKVIKQWSKKIQILHEQDMKNYILLPKVYEFERQGVCGSSGIAKIVYDYFPYSLEGEIQNRKKSIQNEQFSQSQIWKILFVLLKASNFMHKNWKKIGDVRPKNIFYNEEKELRVSCQYSEPIEFTNFQKLLFQKQPSYLAPQELHDIKMGRILPDASRNAKHHIIEAESWSIGLSMLHVVLLFDFQKIYDAFTFQINLSLLHQKISDLENKNNLSAALKNIIKSLLEQIPERRLLSSELILTYLFPYERQILKLEKFDTTKLNSEIKQLMEKKSINSLIGTVWKACDTGFIDSLLMSNRKQAQKLDEARAKQNLINELQKFSEIHPKNSQVSMRQSIRLGGSRNKMAESSVLNNIKQSQTSGDSFHTVGSLNYQKKLRIMGFQIENRFGTNRLPTSGSNVSPQKVFNFQNLSDKFMTPLDQSICFQIIRGNDRSFDFNSAGLLNSKFQNSQAIEDKGFLGIIENQIHESQKIQIQGNFKKQKQKYIS